MRCSPLDETATASRSACSSPRSRRLHDDDETAAYYAGAARRRRPAGRRASPDLADAARAAGPFGRYRGGLLAESTDGPPLRAATPRARSANGSRAALDHAHLLVFRPRERRRGARRPRRGGLDADGIVTLSQLVAFLAFQQRVAAGLRVLTTTEVAA